MSISSYRGILAEFASAPADVRKYFPLLPKLVQDLPLEVAIAYQFILVERAQGRALFGAAMKLHRAHADVAESTIESLHLTRATFLKHYSTIVGEPLPAATVEKLRFAEKVRDKTVHGKDVRASDYRQAVVDVIQYATEVNEHMYKKAKFTPFGDMRGFVGSRESLDARTTSWLMKGLLS